MIVQQTLQTADRIHAASSVVHFAGAFGGGAVALVAAGSGWDAAVATCAALAFTAAAAATAAAVGVAGPLRLRGWRSAAGPPRRKPPPFLTAHHGDTRSLDLSPAEVPPHT